MPESLEHIDKAASKEEKYRQVLAEISSLVQHETDLIANLANISAVLKEIFAFWWVGFYLVKDNQLVLGPFQVRSTRLAPRSSYPLSQGPLACTRIQLNKGVCGSSWGQRKTILVPNVHQFPGHIGMALTRDYSRYLSRSFRSLLVGFLVRDRRADHSNRSERRRRTGAWRAGRGQRARSSFRRDRSAIPRAVGSRINCAVFPLSGNPRKSVSLPKTASEALVLE